MYLPEITISCRPNNQITIGLQNVVKARKNIYQYRYVGKEHYSYEDADGIHTHVPVMAQWQKNKLTDKIKEAKYLTALRAKTKPKSDRFFAKLSPPLDIIRKSQRLPWLAWRAAWKFLTLKKVVSCLIALGQYKIGKAKQFGNVQGQHVREAGSVIDMLCDGRPEFAHVTTLTLPASTEIAFDCMAARSNYAVNRLWEPIRKAYGKDVAWFFVWEYQKRGALHLHICHYHPDATEGMLIGNMLIKQWDKILHDISDESGIDMFEPLPKRRRTFYFQHQHHTQPMRKSAGGYFSKYASKAAKTEENNYIRRFSQTRPPSRFWGSSQTVKNLIKENSFSFSMEDLKGKENLKLFNEIEEMLLNEQIELFDQYDWRIEVKTIEHDTHLKAKPSDKPQKCVRLIKRIVSEGIKKVFYVQPSEYKRIMAAIMAYVKAFTEYF